MLKLFDTDYINVTSFRGRPLFPKFEFIKRAYERNALQIREYYHSRVFYTDGSHILVKILHHITAPMKYDLLRYDQIVRERAIHASKVFQISSEINVGRSHDGDFTGCEEYYVYNEDYYNPYDVERNWKNYSAVKLIEFNKADSTYALPLGSDHGGNRGTTIFSLNLPLLALQYRMYMLSYSDRIENNGVGTVNQFVSRYVLPNMIEDVIDYSIFNRLYYLYRGIDIKDQDFKYRFMIYKYDNILDKILYDVIENIENKTLSYYDMLYRIPSVFKNNQLYNLALPDISHTVQIEWMMYYSRMRIMNFLIDIGGERGVNYNMGLLNHARINLKRVLSNPVYQNALNQSQITEMYVFLDKLNNL